MQISAAIASYEDQRQLGLYVAWHGAALARANKLPGLDRLLKPAMRRRPQNPKQMQALLNTLVSRD